MCNLGLSPFNTNSPPSFELYDNVFAYSDGNQFYFLSKFQYPIRQICHSSLSSNSFLETGLLYFLWLFLCYSLHWYSHAMQTLIHFSARCSCDVKRWHFPVLGKESWWAFLQSRQSSEQIDLARSTFFPEGWVLNRISGIRMQQSFPSKFCSWKTFKHFWLK